MQAYGRQERSDMETEEYVDPVSDADDEEYDGRERIKMTNVQSERPFLSL